MKLILILVVFAFSLTVGAQEPGKAKLDEMQGLLSEKLRSATNNEPFVNSLEMEFVPVPITGGPTDGEKVLFCRWETRVKDYAAYASVNPGVDMQWKDFEWKGQGQEDDHPVINVSWEDAQGFCAWLTEVERKSGRIGAEDVYRLPSDHEWSCAVGIGDREQAADSPQDKHEQIGAVYPWGTGWPPPHGAGNYSESVAKRAFDWKRGITGYSDGYALTAPVGSYLANAYGLYDLGGNCSEWCEDWYDPLEQNYRAWRGGNWGTGRGGGPLSSFRSGHRPSQRHFFYGFRCVLSAAPHPQGSSDQSSP